MRYLIILLTLFSGAVLAQDATFDREFSKFDKDFERLNSWKAETPASKKIKKSTTVPSAVPSDNSDKAEVKPLDGETDSEAGTKTPAVKVEPLKQSDLLGPQIKDPAVRQKVQDLYKRPDVVVQQYVLPTN